MVFDGLRGFGRVQNAEGLHFLEVCAGKHAISTAMAEYGLKGNAYDLEYSRHMNLDKALGLLLLFSLARKVMSHGHAPRYLET